MSAKQAKWSQLSHPPRAAIFRLIPINHYEFIFVTQTVIDEEIVKDGIYKYNSIDKTWNKIINYPQDFRSMHHNSTIDTKNNIIYTANKSKLLQINLNTNNIETLLETTIFGGFPGILFANDRIHIIGGAQNRKHFIFDPTNKKLNEIYGFDCGARCRPIYLKTKRSIITSVYKPPVSIMEFKDNKWTDMKIQNCELLAGSNVMATTKEDYLIFYHGYNVKDSKNHKYIFVYDVRNNILKRSNIEAPSASSISGAVTRNYKQENLLTFGFINQCYKMLQYQNVTPMPFYLIKLIEKWVCYETIHFVELVQDNNHHTIQKVIHWVMDMDKIIASTIQN